MSGHDIGLCSGLVSAQPLWKLAPTRDTDGTSFVDFMMVIPRLKKKPQKYIERTLNEIHLVLSQYSHVVVFADMNLKINCLWISHKFQPGLCHELVAAIRHRVPEAVLVGDPTRC
jgi:hypothetical protein